VGDSISASVRLTTNKGDDQMINIFIFNYPENKIRLDFNIFRADYDYSNDRIIMIPYFYQEFVSIYDVSTNTFHRVELNDQPYDITIMPGGGVATIGFQSNSVVTVNTDEYKVIDYLSTDNDSYETMVGAPGDLVYFFPAYSYDDIGILNISNGAFNKLSLNDNFDVEVAKLHPSGKYIYGSDYSDLAKLNIESSTPFVEYSTYQYNSYNNLWFSKDGNNIFLRSKLKLEINPTLSGLDIISDEPLPFNASYLFNFEHNKQKGEYYAITSNNSSSSYQSDCDKIYNLNENFQAAGTIDLEDFYYSNSGTPGYQIVPPSAAHVFCTSNGNKIIVITEASNDYFGTDAWGIEIFNRN